VTVIAQAELRWRATRDMAWAGTEFSCQDAVIIPTEVDIEAVIAMLGDDTHLTSHQLDQIQIFDFDPGSSDLTWFSTATTTQQTESIFFLDRLCREASIRTAASRGAARAVVRQLPPERHP
jgi:hypothetical protein